MYRCLVCEAKESLSLYRRLIFSVSKHSENIPLDIFIKYKRTDEDTWKMSLNEFLLIRELLLVYTYSYFISF